MNQHLQSDLRNLIAAQSREIRDLTSRVNSQTARLGALDRAASEAERRLREMDREMVSMRQAILEISERQRDPRRTAAA